MENDIAVWEIPNVNNEEGQDFMETVFHVRLYVRDCMSMGNVSCKNLYKFSAFYFRHCLKEHCFKERYKIGN